MVMVCRDRRLDPFSYNWSHIVGSLRAWDAAEVDTCIAYSKTLLLCEESTCTRIATSKRLRTNLQMSLREWKPS